ncbi:MAG: thrombospondin type 3 repeat-containing protein [Deltaproteobacteria bacterium]|nr:thrombospondin type 3 repeat-containing protein [Deltaproteobacteria bacterium]
MRRTPTVIAALFAMGAFLLSPAVQAQAPGECTGGACGTPDTSGGGGGCGCGGGSVLVANTDLGDTYQYADDYDNDGWEDDVDNCAFVTNQGQEDGDGDGIGDSCDNCPGAFNAEQIDSDGDSQGDACDADDDNDGLDDADDNCVTVANPLQNNTDNDGEGDACDGDDDDDGVLDIEDNCPRVANPDQLDSAPNTYGDACDDDMDKDNILDAKDNCPTVANRDQLDGDLDGKGDSCDADMDGDGVTNVQDNCPDLANTLQIDADRDGRGDLCDQRFCYVVGGDQESCLDPTSPFAVYAPSLAVKTGEPARVRIFANRTNTAIRYTWSVTQRPSGSTSTVENPRGTVRFSSPYEYFYLKDNVARFTADEPGTYQLRLTGELVFADTVNENFPRSHTYVMTVVAEGESQGGCSLGGDASSAGLVLLLGLGLLVARRCR